MAQKIPWTTPEIQLWCFMSLPMEKLYIGIRQPFESLFEFRIPKSIF